MFNVLDDGTMKLTRGDTARFCMGTIMNNATDPPSVFQISENDILEFSVKKTVKDEEPLIRKSISGNEAFHISGLTSIGNHAFDGCSKLALTSLPSGLTSIGAYVFSRCSKLALTSLPSGLTSIGTYAFRSCSKLALTSLPSGLTSIGTQVFDACSSLALTSLPSGLTSIGNYAFRNCSKLASLTFEGTPTSISRTAFSGCTNLTTINVPWAEGAVANAPWGATNATINYNYTGA